MSKFVQSLQVLLFVAVFALAGRAHAALDVFIKFETPSVGAPVIEGTTLDTDMKGCSEVSEVSFGIENVSTIGSASGGAGAGKAKFNDISIKVLASKITTQLFLACAKGGHYSKVTIYFRPSGAAASKVPKPTFVVTLGMVFVKSIELGGSNGDDRATSSISLQCGSMKLETYDQAKGGEISSKPTATAVWNVVNNSESEANQ